jgi:Gas vesicle protein K
MVTTVDSDDAKATERSLVTLVLTLVELLRQLVERQALRRVDVGDLSDDQIERIGSTLMHLERRMQELCEQFDIKPEELNLDLGPLGRLLPDPPPAPRRPPGSRADPSPVAASRRNAQACQDPQSPLRR